MKYVAIKMYNLMGAQLLFHDIININKTIHALEINVKNKKYILISFLQNFIILMKTYGACKELPKSLQPNIFDHTQARNESLVN